MPSRLLVATALVAFLGCTKSPAPPTADQIREAREKSTLTVHKVEKPVLPPLVPIIDLPKTAEGSLAQIGPAAIPALEQALSDPNPQVRRHAARAIGLMGPQAELAVPKLVDLLADPALEVRQAAAQSLGKIGPSAAPAIPRLIQVLGEVPEPAEAPVSPETESSPSPDPSS